LIGIDGKFIKFITRGDSYNVRHEGWKDAASIHAIVIHRRDGEKHPNRDQLIYFYSERCNSTFPSAFSPEAQVDNGFPLRRQQVPLLYSIESSDYVAIHSYCEVIDNL
jgi:hypothetical protein